MTEIPCAPGNARILPGRTPASTPPAFGSGAFSPEDDMKPLQELKTLQTVAECHDWRKRQGELDSMTYLALLQRIDALRRAEGGNA